MMEIRRGRAVRRVAFTWRAALMARTMVGEVNHSSRGITVKIAEMVKELRQERDRLDQAISALSPLIGIQSSKLALTRMNGARRNLSVAARQKIAAAQRARWAKFRASAKNHNNGTSGNRPALSAAARRKIAAAQRARWAKVRQKQESKAA